jgi:3-oxoacyl-[acyl-carrier protein] reductase
MNAQNGRIVVITGGGSGIGQAVAGAFTRAGDRVVVLGRREERLRAVAQALGPAAAWQRVDVSQRDSIAAGVAAVVERHGRLDVLVNNAGFVLGITTQTPLAEAERLWDAVVDANLKGAFLIAMADAPHLPRPGGRIINISSIAAFTGGSRPGAVAYAAAKAGLIGVTYALARELSPQGITVNAIAPGYVAGTEFTGQWSEERIRGIVSETPVGRGGQPNDIAAGVLYLASPDASFVTGEVLNVNGGWLFGR